MGVPGYGVSKLAARHDVSKRSLHGKRVWEPHWNKGDAGAAEGCKAAQIVGFAEGRVLSEEPWKPLNQDHDGRRMVADCPSSVSETLAPIRGDSNVDIAPLGNAASRGS